MARALPHIALSDWSTGPFFSFHSPTQHSQHAQSPSIPTDIPTSRSYQTVRTHPAKKHKAEYNALNVGSQYNKNVKSISACVLPSLLLRVCVACTTVLATCPHLIYGNDLCGNPHTGYAAQKSKQQKHKEC